MIKYSALCAAIGVTGIVYYATGVTPLMVYSIMILAKCIVKE